MKSKRIGNCFEIDPVWKFSFSQLLACLPSVVTISGITPGRSAPNTHSIARLPQCFTSFSFKSLLGVGTMGMGAAFPFLFPQNRLKQSMGASLGFSLCGSRGGAFFSDEIPETWKLYRGQFVAGVFYVCVSMFFILSTSSTTPSIAASGSPPGPSHFPPLCLCS